MFFKVLREYPNTYALGRWNEFLSAFPMACHYVSPAFFLEPFWEERDPFAVLVYDSEERVRAVATGVRKHRRLECGMFVRPQVAMCPEKEPVALAAVLAEGLRTARTQNESSIRLFSWGQIPDLVKHGYTETRAEGEEKTVVLDLALGPEGLFAGFAASRRNNLRKSIKKGMLEIKELETEDEFEQLYPIHLRWCDTKSTPPTPREWLRKAWNIRDHRKILIAKHDGKVVAASYFRFSRGGVVEYAGNNSMPEFLALRPNDLLMWRAIEWACKENFTYFSMGGSHTFLQRFGGEVVSCFMYETDLSRLKTVRLKNRLSDRLEKFYRAIPYSVRQKMKRILKIGPKPINVRRHGADS